MIPACDRFRADATIENAITAATFGWHISDWLFHEQNAFAEVSALKEDAANRCPELGLLRDVCNGTKHRKFDRGAPAVTGISIPPIFAKAFVALIEGLPHFQGRLVGYGPLTIHLNGGTRTFEDVLSAAINWWRANYHLP